MDDSAEDINIYRDNSHGNVQAIENWYFLLFYTNHRKKQAGRTGHCKTLSILLFFIPKDCCKFAFCSPCYRYHVCSYRWRKFYFFSPSWTVKIRVKLCLQRYRHETHIHSPTGDWRVPHQHVYSSQTGVLWFAFIRQYFTSDTHYCVIFFHNTE